MIGKVVMIGVIGLESYFTKFKGHIRNPETFDFPVTYAVMEGITPDLVVNTPDRNIAASLIQAAEILEAQGVHAITGSCGFMALYQRDVAEKIRIPTYLSSLMQAPWVASLIRPDQRIGIITANETTLTERHLAAAGMAGIPCHIVGLSDKQEFQEVIIEQRRHDLDYQKMEAEVLDTAKTLLDSCHDLGAVVLECTDLPPFAKQIQDLVQKPVFDIVTLTRMVNDACSRTPFINEIGVRETYGAAING